MDINLDDIWQPDPLGAEEESTPETGTPESVETQDAEPQEGVEAFQEPEEEETGTLVLDQTGLLTCSGMAGMVGLIGRDKELAELQTRIDRKQSILIFGERFIGKTVLLEQLYQNNADQQVIFIQQTKPLATLFEILFQKLYEWNWIHSTSFKQEDYQGFSELWRALKRETTAVKINILEQILAVHRNIVFLVDDVDQIPITGERLLAVMVTYGTIIGTAKDKKQSMMSIYFRSLRYGLDGISEENIRLISSLFLKKSNLSVQDETHLVKHLSRAVGGNPGAVSDLLYSLENEPTVTRDKARSLIHKAGTAEINIGLFWILLGVMIAAFRVYGMKTGNLPVMIGGTIILMLLMIFRGPLMKGIQQTRR